MIGLAQWTKYENMINDNSYFPNHVHYVQTPNSF